MLDVIVKGSEWLRGEGGGDSYLHRRDDHKKCCLGIAACAAGVPPGFLYGLKTPAELACIEGCIHFKALVYRDDSSYNGLKNSTLTNDMMSVNDNRDMPDVLRTGQLSILGREAGINFIFKLDE